MLLETDDIFSLDNFEGPLDFLIQLIQKEELNIHHIRIQEITRQFLQKLQEWQQQRVDVGAEWVGTTAYLVWLKSKYLLPQQEKDLAHEEEIGFRLELIDHLLDYCQFKEMAKTLSLRQEQQESCFFRGIPENQLQAKTIGIHHITLEELSSLFSELIKKASPTIPQIHEEPWKVSDKIDWIRSIFAEKSSENLENFFSIFHSKLELIVIFLAILELMKIGEIEIQKKENTILLHKKKVKNG